MNPSPAVVADTVARLLRDPWPADEAALDGWLTGHGIKPTEQVGPWPSWGTGISGWGDAHTCWALDGEEVVGVGWFLWPQDAAGELGAELLGLLTERFGEPTERCAGPAPCWWEWTDGDVVVEFATGTAEDARTQVHLVRKSHVEVGVLGECAPGAGWS